MHIGRAFWHRLAAVTGLCLVAASCSAVPGPTPQEQVDQIVAFVEAARGHDFVTEPTVQFLDGATFEAEVLASLAAAEPDVAEDDVLFTALDWITPAQDLVTEYRKAFGGGVVGFYDPVSEALKVRGTSLTPYRREVIAHELTHALDDQIHDLDDITATGLVDEEYLGALVAIEGSAEKVRQRYYNAMSPLEQAASINEQLTAGNDPQLLTVPIALLTLTSVPYVRGPAFSQELINALGNPAGVDESLTRYPDNTEQAFSSTKYLADEPATVVPTPPTDGSAPLVRSGQFGPLPLSLVLREGLVLDALDPATAGWEGGTYATWRDGTASCVRIDVDLDSPAAAGTLQSALGAWASRHAGTTIESPAADQLRLTRCDG
jgi:hypothetical protein